MINLPRDRMDQVVKRFDMLEAQMAAGPAADAYVKMASEYADIQEMVGKIRALRAAEREQGDLEAMLADKATDAEMRALAEADLYLFRGGHYPALATCGRGMLLRALGRTAEGDEALRQVFVLPDKGMPHHIARLALQER